jgi:hypothetical protein
MKVGCVYVFLNSARGETPALALKGPAPSTLSTHTGWRDRCVSPAEGRHRSKPHCAVRAGWANAALIYWRRHECLLSYALCKPGDAAWN